MGKKKKKNIYTHKIDLTPLTIRNQERDKFRQELEHIRYRGYEVEQLSDGRKIVITKPGGKFVFGTIKRDDFTSPMRGKTMGLILSAYEDIGLKIVEGSFNLIADYSGMRFRSLLVSNARESGEVKDIKGIRGRVKKFAQSLNF